LQALLMKQPDAGDLIRDTGGLRVIYYWWDAGLQFWLFTLYVRDERSDLSAAQRRAMKALVKAELDARSAR
jgi:hypothetical protein